LSLGDELASYAGGASLLIVAHWRAIFGAYVTMALITFIWFALRQPQALAFGRRIYDTQPRRSGRDALGWT
jgi:predicted MFS family arabinose efflux permease